MLKNFKKRIIVKRLKQSTLSQLETIHQSLDENIKLVYQNFGLTSDLSIRRFHLGKNRRIRVALLFLTGLTDKNVLDRDVIEPLMKAEIDDSKEMAEELLASVLHVSNANIEHTFESTLDELSGGKAVLFIDNQNKVIIIDAKALEQRNVEEPVTEAVIRGPREGFTEDITTNLALIRKRCHNRYLQVETYSLGTQTKTGVSLVYLRGIVKEELLVEVRKRLSVINIDAILDSGYIEQWIEDEPLSIFPTVANTEKPDIVLAKILEGRVAILVDGTPVALFCSSYFSGFFSER